jgi:hypothetical protein
MSVAERTPETRQRLDSEEPVIDECAVNGWMMMLVIFDIWDFDGNHAIDRQELFAGLGRFCKVKGIPLRYNVIDSIYDEVNDNEDSELDQREFSVFLSKYAEASGISLNDLAFFMVQQESKKAEARSTGTPSTFFFSDLLRRLKDEQISM